LTADRIAAVVLAAGEGRRYGGPKQVLHAVGGRPMLEVVLRTLERTGLSHRVVVLGARAGPILAAIELHGSTPVVCERWADGQAASLHTGLGALDPGIGWALVVLGDGPGLDPRAVDRLAARAADADPTLLAADYGSGRSHPVLIPRARWAEIPDTGDTPVRGMGAELVDCRGLAAPGDVDYAASS
jgi:CTP:molybdopterin cytidylyltransferase MocA